MSEFNTSLLREKFTIQDVMPADLSDHGPVIALSNRLALPLMWETSDTAETYVVRAQNMHLCARLAAQIAHDFQENGPFIDREKPFDFAEAYKTIVKGYEDKWNKAHWSAVYHKGRVLFEGGPGKRHPFVDIIEQCDARNKDDYAKAVRVAEDAFKQAGRLVRIEHDSNIALVVSIKPEEGKCGVIVRGPARTTTFNFTARQKQGRKVRVSQILSAAAAYLEGIQIAFLVGMTDQKVRYDMIERSSEEARKAEEASKKLGRLNVALSQFESLLDVFYRPDRPDFAKMVDEAGEFARKVLSAEIEKKIKSGEVDPKDWVV